MRTLPLAGLLALAPGLAGAQTLELTLTPQAQSAGLDEAALESSLNGAIGEALKLGTQDQHDAFIDSMIEAAAISARGLGVDYASNIEKVVVGGAVGSGVHESGFTFGRGKDLLPKGGFGAQISLMTGVNLGMGGEEHKAADRFRLYVNGLAMRLPSDRNFGGQMANAGAHLQIKLIEGNYGAKVVESGGLDLTSGFEYSAYSFDLRETLPIEAPLGGNSGSVTWNADGSYNINSDVMAVPIELSTNLRIFVVSLYLGGGYDVNVMATGTSGAALAGPLSGRVLAPDGSTYDGDVGDASITAQANGQGGPGAMRIFAGAQLNVLMFKGFAHLNVEPLNGAIGGHVGARVAI